MTDSLLAATRKGLFRIDRQAGTWAVADAQFLGDEFSLVAQDPRDRTVFAVMQHGHFGTKIHRTRDLGQTWEEKPAPEYPAKPDGVEDINASTGKPIPWKLDRIWALTASGPDEPGVLWCGTLPGGLFRSSDSGETWELCEALWFHPARKRWFGGGADWPGIHSICVDPRDSKRVVLGVSCGGVWVTRDGGASWACKAQGMIAEYMPPGQQDDPEIQDPHCVVQCPSAPDTLWAQHHNGIFKTVDGCESWQRIENAKPSAFGFPVAVHPRDADRAWFVPAIQDQQRIPVDGAVVVSRTRDGGASFDVLTRGLPREHAYDLVFRHALDIDTTGDRLAFGSTTGSLWVTEDQGDHWQTVAEHLPPIYCVRWLA